jgi:two-component system response regulator PilR (NtrC family)
MILIADDDEGVRTMLGRFLEAENFNVVFARNGTQALFEVLIMPYDLALIDLKMPGAGGWEVFESLSKLHPRMPIIIMTGQPNQRAHAECAGVDGFLEKPIDPWLLLETIHGALARHAPVRTTRLARPDREAAAQPQAEAAVPLNLHA